MSDKTQPFCCRCKEEFPVRPGAAQIGQMKPLKEYPQHIQRRLRDWVDSEIHGTGYLCGNCYFDLTD